MIEKSPIPASTQEINYSTPEIAPVSIEDTEAPARGEQAKADTERNEAVGLALQRVHETQDAADLESIIAGIDFSEDKFDFRIANTYHAEVKTFNINSMERGLLEWGAPVYPDPKDHSINPGNLWGNPRQKAHSSREPVEQVGVRSMPDYKFESQEKIVRRRGLAGFLGLKQKYMERVQVGKGAKYIFDYAFAAPARGDDAAKRSGNYSGQTIELSVEITRDQAVQLSGILAKNPKAARQVLDGFMRSTGDYGKWNAELYDDEGNFHDPAERYGVNLEARDVRPTYDAAPSLEPKIIGLIDRDIDEQ